jgi:uncharacterized membrane protein required for colicin V production
VQVFVAPPPPSSLNWFDAAVLALLILFGWRGYRRGLIGWVAGMGASLLALVTAIALAPVVAPLVAGHSSLANLVVERLTFVGLLFLLRFLLGWALHELVAAIRPVLRSLQPLDLVDHLLGVIPSIALGAVLVLAVLAVTLLLPVDRRLHDAASRSYVGRVAGLEAGHVVASLTTGSRLPEPARILDLPQALTALHTLSPNGFIP